jgi:hypothetical protein
LNWAIAIGAYIKTDPFKPHQKECALFALKEGNAVFNMNLAIAT